MISSQSADQINENGRKLDEIIQDLRSSRRNTHDKLPSVFKNPEFLSHTERLISSASTVIGQGSTVWGGSERGFPHSSEAGRSLDKAKRSNIEDWIPQLTITEEEGSQTSEHQAFTAASETLVEERRLDVEEMEYSDSDGDVNYDFAQNCFEQAEVCFSTNQHDEAIKLFRSGLKRANRLGFEKQNRLEVRNIKREFALSLLYQGNLDESQCLLQSLVRGTGDTMLALHASSGLALLYLCKRSFAEAEDWCQKSQEGWRRALGKRGEVEGRRHPLYVDSLKLTAFLYELKGDSVDASIFEQLAKKAQTLVDESSDMPMLLGFTADQSRDLVKRYHQAPSAPKALHDPPETPGAPLDSNAPLVIHIEDIETPKRTHELHLKPQTPNHAVKPSSEVSIFDLGTSPQSEDNMEAKDTNPFRKKPSTASDPGTPSSSQLPFSNFRFGSYSESIGSGDSFNTNSESHQGDGNSFSKRVRDSRTRSALLSAARKGDVVALEKLLNRGAPIEAKSSRGETALCLAVIGGHIPAMETLLRHKAMVEAQTNNGCTPLLCARENVAQSRLGAMRTLLQAGAKIDARDEHGDTALSHAVAFSRPDWVKVLLEFKPILDIRNNTGKTALLRAVDFSVIVYAKPLLETVKLLLDAGADMKATDDKGQTAVLIAVHAIALRTGFDEKYWRDYVELVELLCARGVDATVPSVKGTLPLSYTGQIKDTAFRDAVRKVLIRYGATP